MTGEIGEERRDENEMEFVKYEYVIGKAVSGLKFFMVKLVESNTVQGNEKSI